jgi:heterodisulfide reductase subunit B
VDLITLDDWNCCGATAYSSIAELQSFCFSARNLAMAQHEERDLVAACAACYTTLRKTDSYFWKYPEVKEKVSEALSTVGLTYDKKVNIRHLVDVIANEPEILNMLKEKVKVKLTGLNVASYHGCELVRPVDEHSFDDPEFPHTLDRLVTAVGAEAVPFPLTTRCCGGSMTMSRPEITVSHINKLLRCAVENGAQCIIVACPVCQINLDGYQGKVNARYKTNYKVPILYFTQLLGIALGFNLKELGLQRNIISVKKLLSPYVS